MRIQFGHTDSLTDELPKIQILEAPPDAAVTMTATTTDARGNRWESNAVYAADAQGVVDLASAAPTSGDYTEADAAGLIWSMHFAQEGAEPDMFAAPVDALTITITAGIEGAGQRVSAAAVRRWTGSGVTRSELHGDGFGLRLFTPPGDGPFAAIAVVPGTTGPAADEPVAALLASHGYLAAVVDYLASDAESATMLEVPIENIANAVKGLAGQPNAAAGKLAVHCASVGSEAALAALSYVEGVEVAAVVAVAPSSVVWEGIRDGRPQKKSSLTFEGKPLPYAKLHAERLMPELIENVVLHDVFRRHRPMALHLRKSYAPGLKDKAAAEAAIPVEKIAAPMQLISGADDQMWPSDDMATAIIERRKAAGHTGDLHFNFQNAGHILRPPYTPTTITWVGAMYSGGTPQGVASAGARAWREMLAFLRLNLGT